MDVQNFRKFFNSRNRWAYSLSIFNINYMAFWKHRKQIYFVSWGRLYTSLKEHATNVINFEKKKVLPLIKEEVKSHQDAKFCYIWKKKSKSYRKVRDDCHFTGKYKVQLVAHIIWDLDLMCLIKPLQLVLHNASNYDYNSIKNN